MSHGNADNGVTTPRSTFYEQGRFGRMFPTLPPFAADTPTIRQALVEIGQAGESWTPRTTSPTRSP